MLNYMKISHETSCLFSGNFLVICLVCFIFCRNSVGLWQTKHFEITYFTLEIHNGEQQSALEEMLHAPVEYNSIRGINHVSVIRQIGMNRMHLLYK